MGNIILALFFVGLLAAMLLSFVRGVRVQHEGTVGVVEAWGRFARVVPPGRYILWPWEEIGGEIPLQIFEYETPPQQIATRGMPMTVTMVVHFQIEHAHRTPGAPQQFQVLGTQPLPVGTPQLAPVYAGSNAPAVAQNRLLNNPDALEPATRPRTPQARGGGRAAAGAAGVARRTTTPIIGRAGGAVLARVLGRTGQLDIEHAAYRARYAVPNWRDATEHEAVATLQQIFSTISVVEDIIGNLNWQHELGEKVRGRLSAKTERWGVEILDVTFKDLKLPEIALQNLNAETRLEREARNRAREAENYKNIADILGLSPGELLRWRQIEVLRELAKNPQARIMFSTDMAGRSGGASFMSEDQNPPAPRAPQNYLGSEPPTPALGPGAPRADGGSTSYPTAPSLQRTDQQ